MTSDMRTAMKKAEKKDQQKNGKADPFTLDADLRTLDNRLGDLEEAQKAAEKAAAEKAAQEAKKTEFIAKVFPYLAALMERREVRRAPGMSRQFLQVNSSIDQLFARKGKEVKRIVATAFIEAAADSETGIKDPNVLLQELKNRELIVLVEKEDVFHFSVFRKKFCLTFEPIEDRRISMIQMLRERFGEVEQAKINEAKTYRQELEKLSGLTIWDIFAGEKGTFCLHRPFEKVVRDKGSDWKFYPGLIAGESDGKQIIIIGATGGCQKTANEVHENGLSLPINTLNNEDFWTKRDELKPLVPLHRTLWAIRRFAQKTGDTPQIVAQMGEWMKPGMMKPETFFADTTKPGTCLIVFNEANETGKTKPWKWYHRGGSQREKAGHQDDFQSYDPMNNVFAVLKREGGKTYWLKIPAHLADMFNSRNIGPEADLSKKGSVRGSALALYNWASRVYAPAVPAETATETKANATT